MLSFIKTLFGKPDREPAIQELTDEAKAAIAFYRERDIASMRRAGFDLADEQFDMLQSNLETDDEAITDELADELADAFVSAMFDRRNDPISAIPRGDFDFIAVDVETATRDSATICQIGLACVRGEEIQSFVTLVNPETPIEDRNYAVHMIEDNDLAGMPTFPEVFAALGPLLKRHLLVQHSSFDQQAFDRACARYDLPPLSSKWGDSINSAKHAWPEFKGAGGYGLRNLADKLSIEFSHHDAGEDAYACANIVLQAREKTGLAVNDMVIAPPSRRRKSYPETVTRDANPKGLLSGYCAVFTGSLTISRSEAADLAADAGIRVVTTVSKKVTLLIVGDQDLSLLAGHEKSSKHRKAEELIASGQGIRILGEAEFISLIKS